MKTHLLLPNRINYLLVSLFCLSLYSCMNEPSNTLSQNNEVNPYKNYLLKKTNTNNLILSRSDIYTISEALEYLNDGLNYLYCRPTDYFAESRHFADTFTVSVTSGEITENDLLNLMESISEFAGDNFYGDTRTSKAPLLFYIRQLFSPSLSYTFFEANFSMEAGVPAGPVDSFPYEDSWIYGEWGENVSSLCNHEVLDYDATDLFRRDLRKNLTYRESEGGYYFRDPYGVCFAGTGDPDRPCFFVNELTPHFPIYENYSDEEVRNTDDDYPGDNVYDYLVLREYDGNMNFDECLGVNEMNFQYEAMADLVEGIMPYPQGNAVIGIIEVGYNSYSFFTTTLWHAMEVVVVNRLYVLEEDFEALPLPCCN